MNLCFFNYGFSCFFVVILTLLALETDISGVYRHSGVKLKPDLWTANFGDQRKNIFRLP